MDPLSDYLSELRTGKKLCLLPIARVLVEAPMRLAPNVAIFPPEYLQSPTFRIVSWPKYEYEELSRRYGRTLADGQRVVQVEGDALAWFKSASTGIDIPEFFESVLVALPVTMDWERFLEPAVPRGAFGNDPRRNWRGRSGI